MKISVGAGSSEFGSGLRPGKRVADFRHPIDMCIPYSYIYAFFSLSQRLSNKKITSRLGCLPLQTSHLLFHLSTSTLIPCRSANYYIPRFIRPQIHDIQNVGKKSTPEQDKTKGCYRGKCFGGPLVTPYNLLSRCLVRQLQPRHYVTVNQPIPPGSRLKSLRAIFCFTWWMHVTAWPIPPRFMQDSSPMRIVYVVLLFSPVSWRLTSPKQKYDESKCPAELNLIVAIPDAPHNNTVSSQSPPISQPNILSVCPVADFQVNPTAPICYDFHSPTPKRQISFKDFAIIRLLGKGGTGKVFLALDMKTDKQFALKVIPKADLTPARATRIFEEQRIMLSLKGCPWVSSLKGSFEDTNNFYMLTVSSQL